MEIAINLILLGTEVRGNELTEVAVGGGAEALFVEEISPTADSLTKRNDGNY